MKTSIARALTFVLSVMLSVGCATKNDSITKAERKDTDKPGIAETKAIAEEGFIYGLPIVMNYAVMYEYAVDSNSGQYKAPFNQINNEARVYTYKDTAVVTPNSDTPYSLLLHGPARRADRAVRPSRGEAPLLLGDALSTATPSTTATSAVAPPATKPATTWSSGRTGRARRPPGIKKVFRSVDAVLGWRPIRTQLFNPADMENVIKIQAGYKVQPLSAYLQAARAARGARRSTSPRSTRNSSRRTSSSISTSRCSSRPPGPEETGNPREARPHRHRAGQDLRLQGSLAGAQGGSRSGHEGRRAEGRAAHRQRSARTSTAGGSARLFGDRAFFNGDWLKRAAAAKAGIYAQRRGRGHVSR